MRDPPIDAVAELLDAAEHLTRAAGVVANLAGQRGEVLEDQALVDAVVRVDAETQRHHQFGRYPQARGRGEGGHVLDGGTESGLVAAHEVVGTAVDEYERVGVQPLGGGPVRRPRRPYPGPREPAMRRRRTGRARGDGERQSGVHVEAAAGTGARRAPASTANSGGVASEVTAAG